MVRSKRFELQGRSRERKFPLLLVVITIATITKSPSGLAADEEGGCTPVIGRVVSVQGTVEAQRAGALSWTRISRLDTPVCEGDRLRAARASRAAVFLQPENLIRLDQNSEILFSHTAEETLLEFFQEHTAVAPDALTQGCGAGYVITRFPKKFRIRTPHVNAAVEGTEFLVALRCEVTELAVFEGKVRAQATAQLEEQVLASGQVLSASAAEPPAIRLLVRPADAVQWALYYPPLSDAGVAVPSAEECAQLPAGAIRQVCFAQRAEHLLRLGRVEEAESEISMALAETPASGDALAIRAVISVVKGDKDGALSAAQNAVQISPASSRAWLALSYAQQAQFKLEDATKSVRRAAELSPDSSLTQARLAEMFMSLGRTGDAEKAARRAVEANSNEERAHTVLGFVHLAQINVKEAQADFLKAIERDSTAPLPRLGLGLAIIRQGQLVPGREQLEIAVALDPTNSLLRSYVGKAYYEENTRERDQLAETQFDLAKQLDPNDPTPWFYAAILQQTQGRPVKSFQNLQNSTALNDNRAVYRSRMLLDEDRAARLIDLAQAYRDLGFETRALLEASKSLTYDPGSPSAHRFLAAIYASLPRHDIARQSELLLAQLMRPASIGPVVPDITLADRFAQGVLREPGPIQIGLYEFNPTFVRNGLALQANGVKGEDDTWGDQIALSGLQDRFAFALSQLAYNTDGFRSNNDLHKRLHNAYLQYDVSHLTSVQMEARSFETKFGDRFLRFDPNLFFSDRGEFNGTYLRFGARQQVRPETSLLASLIHVDAANPAEIPGVLTITQDFTTQSAEIRLDHRGFLAHLSSGVGYYAEKKLVNTSFGFTGLDTIPARNAYIYTSLHGFVPGYSLQVGASYDYVGAELGLTEVPQDQINPKLGIIWDVTPGVTLRAAAFKVLKRRFLTNQTLEPTQVGGFNQFFDDPEGTESWRYGLGLDCRPGRFMLTGIEVSNRDLKAPQGGSIDIWREVQGRVYFHWSPVDWLATSLSYEYEKLDRDPASLGADLFAQTKTQIVPLAVTAFSRLGISAKLTTSRVTQEGVFATAPFFSGVAHGSDAFWITDIAVTYRLPRRRGLISVDARNVFGERFRFQETDVVHPRFARSPFVMLRGVVSF